MFACHSEPSAAREHRFVARLKKYVKQGRRLSFETLGQEQGISAGSMLGDVEEESNVEGWAEERLELEVLPRRRLRTSSR